MNFNIWDKMPRERVDDFLANDVRNPARAVVAVEILRFVLGHHTVPPSMVEIGPGVGHDLKNYFEPVVRAGRLRYAAYEGAAIFVEELRAYRRACGGSWEIHQGGFDHLAPASFDITLSANVLEHQPSLEPSLSQQLVATRHLAVVKWFRPPKDEEIIVLPAHADDVHVNQYRRTDVLAAFERRGMTVRIIEDTWADLHSTRIEQPYAIYIGTVRS